MVCIAMRALGIFLNDLTTSWSIIQFLLERKFENNRGVFLPRTQAL
jgi:hypothetical protein